MVKKTQTEAQLPEDSGKAAENVTLLEGVCSSQTYLSLYTFIFYFYLLCIYLFNPFDSVNLFIT